MRAGASALVAFALAGAGAASAAVGGPSGLPPEAAAAVAVTAREFSLTLSRTRVDSGPVRMQLVNRGEDDHDLVVIRADGRAWPFGVAHPGEASARTVRLRPGRYRLICSLEGHESLGMAASLRVKRKPARP
jgi:hypothetical protein